MEQSQIELSYDGVNTTIQCQADEKLKDIFKNFKFKVKAENKMLIYMYNGNILKNEELTFNEVANPEDKKRSKMNILVVEGEGQPVQPPRDYIIKSNNIKLSSITSDCLSTQSNKSLHITVPEHIKL